MNPEAPHSSTRSRLLRVGRVLLRSLPPIALVAWVASTGPWEQMAPRLASAPWLPFALAIAVNFLVFQPIRALRWRFAMHDPPPFPTILAAAVEGSAAGSVLGTAVGDVVRSARLGRPASFALDLGSSVADRVCEYLALTILLGSTAAAGVIPLPWIAAPLGFAVALACVSRWHLAVTRHLSRWPRIQAGLTAMASALTLRRVFAMAALAFAGWSAEILMLHLVLGAVGLPDSAGVAALIVIAINVATAMPGVPANLGTFEAGVVFALAESGVGPDMALSFALLYHGLHMGPTVLVGGLSWTIRSLVAGRLSARRESR